MPRVLNLGYKSGSQAMQKPLVFISHITEEKEIALALKQLVETAFLNFIEVFVSSDPTSIKMGGKWLDEITSALKQCAIEIIIASPISVKRSWINFEAGSGWIRDIPVIPVCHSGMAPSHLPAPLGALQAAGATEESQLMRIMSVLAGKIQCPLPKIDYSSFITVVKQYQITSSQLKAMDEKTPIAPTDGLTPHEFATLVEIAERAETPEESIGVHVIRTSLDKAGYKGVAVTLALARLGRKNLIEISTASDYNNNEFPVVCITVEGWKWLEANEDKLILKTGPIQNRRSAPPPPQDDDSDIPF